MLSRVKLNWTPGRELFGEHAVFTRCISRSSRALFLGYPSRLFALYGSIVPIALLPITSINTDLPLRTRVSSLDPFPIDPERKAELRFPLDEHLLVLPRDHAELALFASLEPVGFPEGST